MTNLVNPLPRTSTPPRRMGPAVPAGLRLLLSVLGWAAPAWTARVAGQLMFRPRRFERPFRERLARAEAQAAWLDTPTGRVRIYRWKSGPLLPWEDRVQRGKVLLVHGFGGRATQLAAFVDPLRGLGFEVLAIDAPAHGEAPGAVLDVRKFRDVVAAVARAEGAFEATVAHSMGAGASIAAALAGAPLGRLVYIGGPYSLASAVDVMSRALGLAQGPARSALDAEIRARVGGFEAFDPSTQSGALATIPGLVVHDVDDREVPFAHAEKLVATWPGARLQATAGLGHRRILRDPVVIDEVVRFVKESLRPAGPSYLVPGPAEWA